MSIVLLWAGLAFVAVGLSLVVLEARAALGAVVADGRIAGHSMDREPSGAMVHAVVEFTDLDGRRRLSESRVGSNAPLGREGDVVKVFLRREDPDGVTIASRATTLVGLAIALLGAVACAVFFATFRTDLLSLSVSAAVTAVLAWKGRAFFAANRGPAFSFKQFKDAALRSPAFEAADRTRIAWADPRLLEASARRQERVNRVAWPVLVAAGVGLVLLGWHLHRTTADFLARAVAGTGRVVELVASHSSDGTTWAAVVEFEDAAGTHRFKDSVASNPPMSRVGDVVPIRTLPEDPSRARVDRGVWSRILPIVIGALGALLVLAGVRLRARPARDEIDATRFRPAA